MPAFRRVLDRRVHRSTRLYGADYIVSFHSVLSFRGAPACLCLYLAFVGYTLEAGYHRRASRLLTSQRSNLVKDEGDAADDNENAARQLAR